MTDLAIIENIVARGDLAQLKPEERVAYYKAVCDSVGLNPLTKPFEYITLNGKLTLYARKDATDQLRARRNVSIIKLEREIVNDIYVVTAYAEHGGRGDSSIGAVSIAGLKGDALANAMMKAETKAKRRVTLSICGLGMLDETEVETIPGAVLPSLPEPPIDIPVVIVDQPEPKADNGNPKSWPSPIVKAVIEAGLTQNPQSFMGAVGYSRLTSSADIDRVLAWFRIYRAWRDLDKQPEEAAALANDGKIPE